MKIDRQKWYERLNYTPRNGQRALDAAVAAGHRFCSMFAFPRCGKSFGAARHVEPYILQPDSHGWIVAPTYALGSKEFGYIWVDFAEQGILQLAETKHFDSRGGNMAIKFPWGAFVEVISADNPSSLRAEELDWLILAEASALPENVFDRHLYARVEKRNGVVLVPTTPKGYNWIYDRFYIPSRKTLKPGWTEWKDNHREPIGGEPNPKYDPAYWSAVVSAIPEYGEILEPGVYSEEAVARARRTLPSQVFREQFGGDFASYAGLIYEFQPNRDECDPFEIPHDWTHILGWDPGARDINPTAIMFGSYDFNGTLYWWDEIYLGPRSTRDFQRMVWQKLAGRTLHALSTDRSAKQIRIELAALGVAATYPEESKIDARIIRMTSMMRDGKMKVMRGRCPNYRREILTWEWDEKNPGKPRPHQACHALDAAGYAALIPVNFRPSGSLDPDVLPGESLEKERLWKGVRRTFRTREEKRREDEEFRVESLLDPDPFVEHGRGQDFDPDAGDEWA